MNPFGSQFGGAPQLNTGSPPDPNEETRVKNAINSILDNLTPETYDVLSQQLLADDLRVLQVESYMRAAIELIFSHAMAHPNLSLTYAALALEMTRASTRRGEQSPFRPMLLDVVQAEFEKLARSSAEGPLSPEQAEARRERRMCNIQFVGNLYNKHLLSDSTILVSVCTMLLTGGGAAHEAGPEDVEVLCRLLRTVGKELESRTSYGKDAYKMTRRLKELYQKLEELSQDASYETRVKSTLVNTLDLKRQGWVLPDSSVTNNLTENPESATSESTGVWAAENTPANRTNPTTEAASAEEAPAASTPPQASSSSASTGADVPLTRVPPRFLEYLLGGSEEVAAHNARADTYRRVARFVGWSAAPPAFDRERRVATEWWNFEFRRRISPLAQRLHRDAFAGPHLPLPNSLRACLDELSAAETAPPPPQAGTGAAAAAAVLPYHSFTRAYCLDCRVRSKGLPRGDCCPKCKAPL